MPGQLVLMCLWRFFLFEVNGLLDTFYDIDECFIDIRPGGDRFSIGWQGLQFGKRRLFPMTGRTIIGMTQASPALCLWIALRNSTLQQYFE